MPRNFKLAIFVAHALAKIIVGKFAQARPAVLVLAVKFAVAG
jgi:hypothetical protein